MIRGIAGLAACVVCAAFGQSEKTPSFEVASIKLHPGPYTTVAVTTSGPRVRITAYGLTSLIMDAYGVKFDAIQGGPSWMNVDRFDIDALAEGDAPPSAARLKLLLQSLLSERFKLTVHRETKVTPVYALVVGKGGPKLKESAPDAEASMSLRSSRATEMTVVKGGIERLARQLSSSPGVDRPVLDQTGLTGHYDYTLRWSSDLGTSSAASDNVSIFVALQEQLGLKLESQRAPIEILIVDHAERPSAN